MRQVGTGRRQFRNNTLGPGGGAGTLGGAISFYAPLETNLSAYGLGSTVPTFSRASVAYIQDHEGILRLASANEARFWGARRVQNKVLRSQDFTNAAWTQLNLTSVTASFADPFGGTNAQKITDNATPGPHGIFQGNTGTEVAANNSWVWSVFLAPQDTTSTSEIIRLQLLDGGSTQGTLATFNIRTGVVTIAPAAFGAATNIVGGIIPSSNGYVRCWIGCTFSGAATGQAVGFAVLGDAASYVGTGTGCRIYQGQLELTSGQTTQSPAEIVSTNVLSSPFQGANVDGVQYFNTTLAGALIPNTTLLGYYSEPGSIPAANQVFQSNSFVTAPWAVTDMTLTANNVVAPTGASEATTVAEGVAGTAVLAQANIAITANTNYVASIYAKKVSGFDWLVVRYTDPTGLGGVQGWVNLATGAAGTSGTFGVLVGTTFSRFIVYPEANGWYRIVLAGIVDNASITSRIQVFSAAADASGVRVNNATYALWTAQLELRHWGISEASTPIVTAGAAGTRSVDALSYTAVGNFLETSGAAYAEGMPASALANGQGLVNEGPNSRELIICANSGQACRIVDGAVSTVTSIGGASWVSRFQFKKFASSWNSSSLLKSAAITDGTTNSGVYSGTFGASITTLRISMNGGSSFGFAGAIRNVRVFNQTLPDAQLTTMVV